MHIEVRSASKAFAQQFSTLFDGEVGSEGAQEQVAGLAHEVVLSAVTVVQVIGLTAAESGRTQGVLGSESITEVRVKDSAIAVPVVSSHEEIDVVLVRVGSQISQSFDDFGTGDPALAVLVKNLESIHEVEVRLGCKSHFSIFKFTLESDLLSQGRDQLFLLVELERRASRESVGLSFELACTRRRAVALRSKAFFFGRLLHELLGDRGTRVVSWSSNSGS